MVCPEIFWKSFKRNEEHREVFRLDIPSPQSKVLLFSEYILFYIRRSLLGFVSWYVCTYLLLSSRQINVKRWKYSIILMWNMATKSYVYSLPYLLRELFLADGGGKKGFFLGPLKLVGVLTLIELGLSEEYFRKEHSTAKTAVHSVPKKVQSSCTGYPINAFLLVFLRKD